jgi:hypothetical protein
LDSGRAIVIAQENMAGMFKVDNELDIGEKAH